MMQINHYLKHFLVAATTLLALSLPACIYDPYYAGPPPSDLGPYDYFYYPDFRVYYHVSSGYYYYPSGSAWVRRRVLPSHVHIHSRNRVHLRIKTNKPYVKHRDHRRRYYRDRDYRVDRKAVRKERQHNREWHNRYNKKYKRKKDDDDDDRRRRR